MSISWFLFLSTKSSASAERSTNANKKADIDYCVNLFRRRIKRTTHPPRVCSVPKYAEHTKQSLPIAMCDNDKQKHAQKTRNNDDKEKIQWDMKQVLTSLDGQIAIALYQIDESRSISRKRNLSRWIEKRGKSTMVAWVALRTIDDVDAYHFDPSYFNQAFRLAFAEDISRSTWVFHFRLVDGTREPT